MTFIAHYTPAKTEQGNERTDYYKTVAANDLREAQMLAKRYQRKGYLLSSLTERL